MSQGKLKLAEADFWGNPVDPVSDIALDQLSNGVEEFTIDAPREVLVPRRKTLPLALVIVAPGKSAVGFDLSTQVIVQAVDLTANRTYANLAVPPVRRSADEPGETPDEGVGEAAIIDLRSVLSLPWTPAEYLIAMIRRDRISNRVRVKVAAEDTGFKDPEVEKYLTARKGDRQPPAIFPAPRAPGPGDGALPDYGRRNGSPPIPDEPGIAIVAPRVLPYGSATPCVLHGSFRVPTSSVELVRPRKDAPPADPAVPRPTAVVPIGLLLTASRSHSPLLWQLQVPCYDAISLDRPPPFVTGWFALDVCQFARLGGEQTYFIYAFSGELMTGPVFMGLVDEGAG